MFVAIRYYQTAPGSTDEVVRRVSEGFVPLVRDTPGFVSYLVLAGLPLHTPKSPLKEPGAVLVVEAF